MQLSIFDNPLIPENKTQQKGKIELTELFDAYVACRSNKRNTANALAFEIDYERNLVQLCHEINNGTYQPGRSIAFIVDKPVKREIFAADFRDRVVHHLIINKLNPLFEKEFIHDSYACREGKGTHFGIKRIEGFIRKCSKNYTANAYILKLDVQGFFMHINCNLLFGRLQQFIISKYQHLDVLLVIELCRKFIFNASTKNCIIKGSKKDWSGLPQNKSLFFSPADCGLPIGNLTSQIFANFYMNSFDHFVKHDLKIRYYGRYVDDFVIVHHDKEFLKSLIPRLSNFLFSTLQLTLHPKKIYLQHYTKGVQFLGTIIKPNRVYIANRTKGNFYEAIIKQNVIARAHKPNAAEKAAFQSSMNSYLGIMKHYKTYRLRKKMIFNNISGWWWNYAFLKGGLAKFVLKPKPAKSVPAHNSGFEPESSNSRPVRLSKIF